jgi:hypothetical protein
LWKGRSGGTRATDGRLGTQESTDLLSEAIGVFDVGEVSTAELDIKGASNVLCKKLAVGGSGGWVVRAGDDESRVADFVELFAEVEIAHCGGASGVAFGVGGFEDPLNVGYGGVIPCSKRRSEPAPDGGRSDVLHSFLSNGGDASVPHFVSSNFGGGAAEDELIQPLRRIGGKPQADLAAHGESAEMETCELQEIGEGENVFGELLDGIGAGRDGRFSVPARIGPENAEGLEKFRHLRIPHGKVRAERIRKDESGLCGLAFEGVVNLRAIRFHEGHGIASPTGILALARRMRFGVMSRLRFRFLLEVFYGELRFANH